MKNATLSDLFKNMLRGQPFSQKPCLGFFLPLIFVIGCSSNENKSTTRLEDVAGTSETDAHPIVLVLLSESAKSSGDSESKEASGIGNQIQKEFKSLEVGDATVLKMTPDEFFGMDSKGEKDDGNATIGLVQKADLVLYPPKYFGELIARKKIRSIPKYVVESESYRASDVLRHQRRLFGYHDKTPFAVSMGTSSLMLMCRGDLFKIHGLKIPTTWEEYERVCKQLKDLQASGDLQIPGIWSPAVEPLKGHWKSTTLISRSAGYVRVGGRYSCLFSYSKGEPLIGTEPFQKSLSEMKRVFGWMDEKHRNLDPMEVEAAFLNGECAMALTWPHPSEEESDDDESVDVVTDARLFPVPGSRFNFGFSDGKWSESDSLQTQVPTLGVGGLCCSVLSTTKQSGVAARRLGLIVGKELSSSICFEDKVNGFPNRASQLADLGNWISDRYPESFAEEFADLVESVNQSSVWMMRPRFEKEAQFETILSDNITECFNGETAADVLVDAAVQVSQLKIDRPLLKKLTLEGFGVEK